MASDIIKEFVKKQTTPITIGVPKPKTAEQTPREIPEPQKVEVPVQAPVQEQAPVVKAHVGRPKSDIEKVKLSVYVPEEAKSKLIRIQHQNFKSSLNDVLMEAISDLIKKYGE